MEKFIVPDVAYKEQHGQEMPPEAVQNYLKANNPEGQEYILESQKDNQNEKEQETTDSEKDKTEQSGDDTKEEKQTTEEKEKVVESATEFDWSEFGEDVKSKDDIKTTIKNLSDKVSQYEKTIQELQESNPFDGNEDLYRLHKLSKEDPEKAEVYKKIIFGNVDGMELLKTSLRMGFDGEIPEDVLEEQIKRKYEDYFSGDYEPDSMEYKLAKFNFEKDVQAAKKEITEPFYKIETPKKKSQEDLENTRVVWQKALKPILEKGVEQTVKVGDDEYTIKIDTKPFISKLSEMSDVLAKNQGDATEGGIRSLIDNIVGNEIRANFSKHLDSYAKRRVDAAIAEYKKRDAGIEETKDVSDKQDSKTKEAIEKNDKAVREYMMGKANINF